MMLLFSEEAFKIITTDRFFDRTDVSDEYICGQDAIIRCPTKYIYDFCHDCIINKRAMGSHIGTVHTLILGVFVRRVDVPRGGGFIRESVLINHRGCEAREG